jgi:parallel beta-helix repeat protein
VINNTVNNKPLIYLEKTSDITITSNAGQVIIIDCNNISIKNQSIHDASVGMMIWNSSNCSISECIVENNTNEIGGGFFISNSSNIIINNNTILNNQYGILQMYCIGNIIINNDFTNDSMSGIVLAASLNTIIKNNTLKNDGVYIASNSFMRGENDSLDHFNTHTIENNTANSKPIRYYKNINNITISNYTSQVILSNCSNITIKDLVFSDIDMPIQIGFTKECMISENTVKDNVFSAIYLSSSYNNKILLNDISNSYISFTLHNSTNNFLYHNNLVNNTENSYDNGDNIWANNYPSGGNYWDDYTGEDYYHGPNQDILGPDGIGDTPYNISGGSNQDLYPLMNPWDENNIVYVDDDYNESTSGWHYDHFNVIQDGIDAVAENGTLYVFNGTYAGDIEINKSVKVLGENRNHSLIDGCVDINSKDVTICNFIIFDSDPNDGYGRSVLVNNDTTIFVNNHLIDCYLYVLYSYNSYIFGNCIENTGYGILLRSSSYCNVMNNTILNCSINGIYIQNDYSYDGWYNQFENNTMIGCGIRIFGNQLNHFIQYINTSNIVDGNPIYYVYNESGVIIPSYAGDVILVSCIDCVVDSTPSRSVTLAYSVNTTIKNNSCALHLYSSHSNVMINNDFLSSSLRNSDNNEILNNTCVSFYIEYCDYNLFKNNHINGSEGNGLSMYSSSFNEIRDNIITNDYGITIGLDSSNNIIHKNIIKNCFKGIRFSSANNLIYHNQFLNNAIHASDLSINTWFNNSMQQGNHWDDYMGTDNDGDGIGDIPYNISDGSNKDLYPLMTEYKPIPHADFKYNIFNNSIDIDPITFNSTLSYDYDGYIINWSWDFGDGHVAAGEIVSHQYTNNGLYTVTLWIADNDLNEASISKNILFDGIYITNLKTDWNLISLPLNLSFAKTDLFVKYDYDNKNWYNATVENIISDFIFDWNREFQYYNFINDLNPGYGYWLYSYVDCEIWVENISIKPEDPYITNLETGWNIIGVPHHENVTKSELLVDDISWSDAVLNGWISDFIFGWDRTGQYYNFDDTLMPGYSYWVYAYQPCNLKRSI